MSELTTEVKALSAQVEDGQFLTFLLAKELYAVDILNIKEIIEYGVVTDVPLMPNYVRGVMNLRGSVVPVIDLQARFGRKTSSVTKRTCIVIVEIVQDDIQQDIGVVVDSVCEVKDLEAGEIKAPPAFGAQIRQDFIQGMGKNGDDFIVILAVEKVLSICELAGIASVVQDECSERL